MVNKEKALKQELIQLRRNQNPQQLDFRRMRKIRIAKAKLRSLKRRAVAPTIEAPVEKAKKTKAKPEKKPKKKEKEPELEIIEDTPETKEISSDLKALYTYDEDIDEEDAE